MPKQLIVDGKTIEVEDGTTLMHACEMAGAVIPRFCYHERLSIAGNCRMCLVEVQGSPKPIASCAMLVNDLPPNRDGSPKIVNTTTPLVKKAREGVMEFLLINHPLDCPICDQGGECDLQDQAIAFGMGGSRYRENKRAVEEKYIGPLIKTIMTRCIHCTRCVRYMTEVAGVEELGLIGRGEDAEITTYLDRGIFSEMSANVVDLCPVGALTHRPWAFAARPWEMDSTETIDVMDALGSAIRVDTRGSAVMRILPRNNDAVNEEWISDKTRHVADGLKIQRLDQPYVRNGGRLEPASWDQALTLVAERLKAAKPEKIGAIAGDLAGAEEMFALKDLLGRFGATSFDCRQAGEKLDPKLGRAGYLFNSSIEGIEQADAILIVGSNPKLEAPVLNARIRKRWRAADIKIALIGAKVDLAYPYEYLGAGPDTLEQIANGKHAFANVLKGVAHPMVIVGQGAHARSDGLAILSLAARLLLAASAGKEASWNGFNILHTAAARVAGLDLGFVPGKGGKDVAGILGLRHGFRLSARRRRVRSLAARFCFRRLSGKPRRPGRGARRRRPPGRRLYGKERHVRQHRRARAADGQGRLSARQRQGRLENPQRTVAARRQYAYPMIQLPSFGRRCIAPPRNSPPSIPSRRARRPDWRRSPNCRAGRDRNLLLRSSPTSI